MRIETKDIVIPSAIACLLLVSSFLFFQLLQPYHLFLKEQIQLFQSTSGYFLSSFEKPAALARLIGEYFTQLFYLRGGGAVTLSILFCIQWVVTTQVLRRFTDSVLLYLWALLPVVGEWIFAVQPSYTLSLPVAFLLTLLCFFIYTAIRGRWLAAGIAFLFIPLLYAVVGPLMLLFFLLILLYEIKQRRGIILPVLCLLLLAAIYPVAVRHFYLLTFPQAYLYPFARWWYLSPSILIILTVAYSQMLSQRNERVTSGSFIRTASLILLVTTLSLIASTDSKREKVLAFATEAYKGNWEKVSRLAETKNISDPIVSYYTNISLSQRGEMNERLLEFDQPGIKGLFLPVDTDTDWLTLFFSSDIFFYLGDMNQAQHLALFGMTMSPERRSTRMVKRLSEVNVIGGNIPAAEKYLRLLDVTLFHGQWADQMRQWMYEEKTDTASWLAIKRKQLVPGDTLYRPAGYAASLQTLLKRNPQNSAALDYLLCYYLLQKDLVAFRNTYDLYCKSKNSDIPTIYSEALVLAFEADNPPKKVKDSYRIGDEVWKRFAEYSLLYEEADQGFEAIGEQFPASYWKYYHFAQIAP